jgi:hypothetical protein
MNDSKTTTTTTTNSWSTSQAAHWAGCTPDQLNELFFKGVLPAIAIGKPHRQKMNTGKVRKRRITRWLIPVQSFKTAWKNFAPMKVGRKAAA